MKVSWSILNAWERGDTEGALAMLRGEGIPPTLAMREGQRVHGWVAQEKMKLLPFMDDTFVWEGAEHHGAGYFRVPLSDDLELSGKVDSYSSEAGWIVDWKTGNTKASSQNPRQIHLYHWLLMQAVGGEYHSGAIARISSGAELLDWVRVQLSTRKAEEAREWAIRIAEEIKHHIGGE